MCKRAQFRCSISLVVVLVQTAEEEEKIFHREISAQNILLFQSIKIITAAWITFLLLLVLLGVFSVFLPLYL